MAVGELKGRSGQVGGLKGRWQQEPAGWRRDTETCDCTHFSTPAWSGLVRSTAQQAFLLFPCRPSIRPRLDDRDHGPHANATIRCYIV